MEHLVELIKSFLEKMESKNKQMGYEVYSIREELEKIINSAHVHGGMFIAVHKDTPGKMVKIFQTFSVKVHTSIPTSAYAEGLALTLRNISVQADKISDRHKKTISQENGYLALLIRARHECTTLIERVKLDR